MHYYSLSTCLPVSPTPSPSVFPLSLCATSLAFRRLKAALAICAGPLGCSSSHPFFRLHTSSLAHFGDTQLAASSKELHLGLPISAEKHARPQTVDAPLPPREHRRRDEGSARSHLRVTADRSANFCTNAQPKSYTGRPAARALRQLHVGCPEGRSVVVQHEPGRRQGVCAAFLCFLGQPLSQNAAPGRKSREP